MHWISMEDDTMLRDPEYVQLLTRVTLDVISAQDVWKWLQTPGCLRKSYKKEEMKNTDLTVSHLISNTFWKEAQWNFKGIWTHNCKLLWIIWQNKDIFFSFVTFIWYISVNFGSAPINCNCIEKKIPSHGLQKGKKNKSHTDVRMPWVLKIIIFFLVWITFLLI